MPSDLWSFTLDFYAKPGVEQACLALQADGANVCLLLCGVWLQVRDVPCTDERVDELRRAAEPWHFEVVTPLRELRTRWKPMAQRNVALAGLRERIKVMELDAERQLLEGLQTQTATWPVARALDVRDWVAELAGGSGSHNRDALQVLRVAAGLATDCA